MTTRMMHQALIVLRWLSYLLVFSTLVACGLKGDLFLPTETETVTSNTPDATNGNEDEQEEETDGL